MTGLDSRRRSTLQKYFVRSCSIKYEAASRNASLLATNPLVEYPELMLGSYPRIGEEHYRVMLTLESRDEAYLTAAVDSLLQRLPSDGVYRVD